MALTSGTRLGRYEILATLGSGGMGQVYRAHDANLRRDVAVKVLLEEFAADPARLKRFEREAMATAALNHPNILAVYDVGTSDGVTFVVSELLEGRTLRDVLAAGPMPMRRAVKYGAEIAEGLAAAHAKGIVHRDLKPANIFITSDDRVKILDFGLARILDDSPTVDGVSAPTATTSLTAPGTVLGSAGYMAPEQVRGLPTDHRADIFSLGTVLYEMLSGRRAFHRETVAGTLAAIVETDPPSWSGDGTAVSERLRRLVRRCLEKSPNDRFQSARDLALVLADENTDSRSAEVDTPRRVARGWLPLAVTALACLALGAWGWSRVGDRPLVSSAAPAVTFEVPPPDGTTWSPGFHPAISNDGTHIVFRAARNGQTQLFVRRLSELTSHAIPGTSGAGMPFFSPDGHSVGFFADQQLKAVDLDRGIPRVVCPAPAARGGAWGDDGMIVFAAGLDTGLSRVNANGGNPEPLTTLQPGQASHRFPQVFPGSAGVVFVVQGSDGVERVGAYDVRSQRLSVVVDSGSAPQVGSNRLYFLNRNREWMAVPFDAASLTVNGPAEPQPERSATGAFLGDASLSVARNGALVYLPFEATLRSIVIVDRNGQVMPIPGPPRSFGGLRLSPDGTRLAVSIGWADNNWGDIWIADLSGSFFPLTNDHLSRFPEWSPDGRQVAFESRRNGLPAVFAQAIQGGASAIQLTEAGGDSVPASWVGDGQTLLISNSAIRPGLESPATVTLGDRTIAPVRLPVTGTAYGRLSRDGKWLAYTTRDSGQWEIYVTPFPGLGQVWQVSQAGSGIEPVWGPRGELFFRRVDGRLVAITVGANGPLGGAPRAVPTGGLKFGAEGAGAPHYDVLPDGRLLILRTDSDRQGVRPLVVVVR